MDNANPYAAPNSDVLKQASQCCGVCDEKFVLTWKKYLTHHMGRYKCDSCKADIRLIRPKLYYLSVILFYVVELLLVSAMGSLLLRQMVTVIDIALVIIAFFLIFLLIDKNVESKFNIKNI